MTDPLGQSQVIPYLQGLQKHGHEVHLLSCEKPAAYESGKQNISTVLESSQIQWHPIAYTSKPPVLSTLKDVNALKKKAAELIQTQGIEVLHCRSYIAALVGAYCKRKFHTPWIFDMRGFWADERVDGKIWNLSNPLFNQVYRFFKRKEKEFLLGADQVISLTSNARDEIHSWKGFENVPITVIPCCADLSLFNPAQIDHARKLALRQELQIPENAFVLSYLGSLGTWYMLPEMLDFFKELIREKPEAIFLFITGDAPDSILREAAAKGIDASSIRVMKAARKEVPVLASISDVSIFFILPVFSKKASSPTKMGELMSLGIPLICNDGVGDVSRILEDGGNGLVIREFTSAAYRDACKHLQKIVSADPTSTMDCASRYYSLADGVRKYAGVYEKITRGGKDVG